MRSPLSAGTWIEVEETPSTQQTAREALLNSTDPVGAIFAVNQTQGRGRFDRQWFSEAGNSLTMSLLFREQANHPRPWLVGMAVAVSAAAVIHCRLRWPNDLYLDDKKVGGILTEIFPDAAGRSVPVVGLGINLDILNFPADIAPHATSLALHRPGVHDPRTVGEQIVARLNDLPEPEHWSDLQPVWTLFDDTPGKRYRLISGEEAIAIGIGPEGELICAVEGETTMVLAAEAILGA